MSSGYTYAQARLAIDEYNENKRKMDYTTEVVDLWNEALKNANDTSLGTGLFGAVVGLATGDWEDAWLGWNIGSEVGYHAAWEFGDGNDIVDTVLNYEDAIGDIKFNQGEFENGLHELQGDMDDIIYDARISTLFNVMGNLKTYGDMGGYIEGGPATQDMGIWERVGYNIKDAFGAGDIIVPPEFADETAYFTHIMKELDEGKSIEQILTKKQIRDLLGVSSQSLNIEALMKKRTMTWPGDGE